MDKENAENEIKYRLALLQVQALLEQGKINDERFIAIKIELIKKYNPMIGGLELDE